MASLNIRHLPEPLYEELKARAQRARRSVAQEATGVLAAALDKPISVSILELEGLGKELWQGIDAAAHVEAERASWD